MIDALCGHYGHNCAFFPKIEMSMPFQTSLLLTLHRLIQDKG